MKAGTLLYPRLRLLGGIILLAALPRLGRAQAPDSLRQPAKSAAWRTLIRQMVGDTTFGRHGVQVGWIPLLTKGQIQVTYFYRVDKEWSVGLTYERNHGLTEKTDFENRQGQFTDYANYREVVVSPFVRYFPQTPFTLRHLKWSYLTLGLLYNQQWREGAIHLKNFPDPNPLAYADIVRYVGPSVGLGKIMLLGRRLTLDMLLAAHYTWMFNTNQPAVEGLAYDNGFSLKPKFSLGFRF